LEGLGELMDVVSFIADDPDRRREEGGGSRREEEEEGGRSCQW